MRCDYLTWFFRKFNAFVLAVFVLLIPFASLRAPLHFDVDHSADQTNYPFVFLHGFQGWNEDAKGYKGMQYWGMFNGDALRGFREAGYTCVAPMVDPVGSVWDRTCELYAKLKGTRVDYGEAHSAQCGHDRYGEDYTGKALLKEWDSEHKCNLIGHSLGGNNCVLLASLLAFGAQAERDRTTDGTLSELFTGGKGDWIHAVVGLAAVYNGTSLFVNHQAVRDTQRYIKEQLAEQKLILPLMRALINKSVDGVSDLLADISSGTVAAPDTAIYDMQPEHAAELNQIIGTSDSVYYISEVQDATMPSKLDGHLIADPDVSDPIIGLLVPIIARTNTVAADGTPLDEAWQANDGCANVISQRAPFGAPVNELGIAPSASAAAKAQKGVYNILPTVRATHMWPIGDFLKPRMDGLLYLQKLMEMVNALA